VRISFSIDVWEIFVLKRETNVNNNISDANIWQFHIFETIRDRNIKNVRIDRPKININWLVFITKYVDNNRKTIEKKNTRIKYS